MLCKKQSFVTFSSAEAEYVFAAHATQELQWLISLLDDLDMPQELPIKLFKDNQSCIKMIQHSEYMSRTKHVDVNYQIFEKRWYYSTHIPTCTGHDSGYHDEILA